MAQFLKDDVRDKIIESATEEFIKNGYEKASMRSIALKSRVTVGNIYRYFKSKDELNNIIVAPAYLALDKLIKNITGGKVGLGSALEDIPQDPEELKAMFASLNEGLVDIYIKHRAQLTILMMGSKLNKELTGWFSALIAELVSRNFKVAKDHAAVKILADCYAADIFSGVRTILKEGGNDPEMIKLMIGIYINSYLAMLGQDLSALV